MSGAVYTVDARFEVIRELGQGGEGRVFEVLDRARGHTVALKEARGPRRDALAAEFRLLHRLSHPHMVGVFDFFSASPLSPEASAYTLERVDGVDLVSALRRDGLGVLPGITTALLQALAQLHLAGVAHLDLKPENVLIAGESRRLRLIDFGIAHPLGTPLARVLGSRSYLAPELAEGAPVAATADLFGLGVILAECLLSPADASPATARALAQVPLATRREALREAAHTDALAAVVELAALCLEPESKRPRTAVEAARRYGVALGREVALLGPSAALALARSGGLVAREAELAEAASRAQVGTPTFVAGEGRAAFITEVVHRAQLEGIPAELWPLSEPPTTADFVAALSRLTALSIAVPDDPDLFAPALLAALSGGGPVALLGVTRPERAPLPVRRFFEALGARPPEPLRVALVLRAEAGSSVPPNSPAAEAGPAILSLPAADEAAVRAFVLSRFFPQSARAGAAERLVRWLVATAAGSFAELEALAELLVAKGHLAMGPAGWEAELDTVVVRGRIPERLAAFPPFTRRVVAALMTTGSPVPPAVLVPALASALARPEEEIRGALEELELAGWFDGAGLPLVIAAALPATELTPVLAAFVGRPGLPPALEARALASVGRAEEGARHLVAHIDAHMARYQVEEARALCQLGLSLAPAVGELRLALLRRFAQVADLLGPREAQRDALEALLQALPDGDEALETRSRLFWTKTRMGDPSFEAEGRAVCERASAQGRHTLAAEVGVHLAIAASQRGDQDAAEALLIQAQADVAAANRPEDAPEVLALTARIANNLGNVALYRHDHLAAQRHYQEALDKKRRQGDPVGERIALGNLALAELELGRPTACLEALIASRTIARATSHRRGEAWSLLTMAELGLECGAWDYAERRARLAASIAEALGDALVTSDALATLAEVLHLRGRPAAETAARAASLASACDNRWTAMRAGTLVAAERQDEGPLQATVDSTGADPATRRLAAQLLIERRFARGELRIPREWSELLRADNDQPVRLGLRAASAWATGLRALELCDPRAAARHRGAARTRLARWIAALPAQPLDDLVDAEGQLDGPCVNTARRSPAMAAGLGLGEGAGALDGAALGWEDEGSAREGALSTPEGPMAGTTGLTLSELAHGGPEALERALGEALAQLVREHAAERGFLVLSGEGPPTLLESRDTDGEAVSGGARRLPEVALETVARLVAQNAGPWRGLDGRGALCIVPVHLPVGPARACVALILQNRFIPDAFDPPHAISQAAEGLFALTRLLLTERALADALRARDEALTRARELQRETTAEIRALRRELESTREQLGPEHAYRGIIYTSGAMKRLLRQVDRVLATELPVHIHGESGTGKELIARAIHDHGSRAQGPFVPQNCTAIPQSLFESEFFGHERGSFTGAVRAADGLFRRAHLGTLFLDEVGDLPLELQAKLLRVIETGEVRPVGSSRSYAVDVRIVSATHRDLKELVARGAFREDLYYRLNVIRVDIPPLRHRPEDIPLLARHFLSQRGEPRRFDEAALKALMRYAWPGNVRQLDNEVRRAAVLADNETIGIHDLSPELLEAPPATLPRAHEPDHGLDLSRLSSGPLKDRVDHLETAALRRALLDLQHNKSEVARTLGLSRAGLNLKLKRLGLWDGE